MKHLTEMVRQHKAGKTNGIYAVCFARFVLHGASDVPDEYVRRTIGARRLQSQRCNRVEDRLL